MKTVFTDVICASSSITIIHNADHNSFASVTLYPGWQHLYIESRLASTLAQIVLEESGDTKVAP